MNNWKKIKIEKQGNQFAGNHRKIQKLFLSINNQTLPEKKKTRIMAFMKKRIWSIKEEEGGNPRKRLTAQMGFSRESQPHKQANSFPLYNICLSFPEAHIVNWVNVGRQDKKKNLNIRCSRTLSILSGSVKNWESSSSKKWKCFVVSRGGRLQPARFLRPKKTWDFCFRKKKKKI